MIPNNTGLPGETFCLLAVLNGEGHKNAVWAPGHNFNGAYLTSSGLDMSSDFPLKLWSWAAK